jgi:DeoR/GlpR family transcriptional regulator of sugar metabolism
MRYSAEMAIRTDERRASIVRLVSALGELSVEDLALRLGVTESTVRRDLQRLASEGRIMRSFGAAVAARRGLSEPSLAERIATSRIEKDAIGAWGAAQVCEGETILLDAGTTTGRVAAHLRDRSKITVVTNGLTALSELSHADRVEVLVLGGRLRQLSQGLVGPLTDSSLGALTFDRIFLGADGLRADLGICEAEIEQTRTKELMASRADHVYVVADSSKLGARPFNAWARLKWYTLVTDDGATDEALEPFRNNPDIEVVLAPCNHLDVPGRRSTLATI